MRKLSGTKRGRKNEGGGTGLVTSDHIFLRYRVEPICKKVSSQELTIIKMFVSVSPAPPVGSMAELVSQLDFEGSLRLIENLPGDTVHSIKSVLRSLPDPGGGCPLSWIMRKQTSTETCLCSYNQS